MKPKPTEKHRRSRLFHAALLLATFAMVGCQTVSFYEKELLSGPLMVLDEDPTETIFFQKTFYSREASIGGIGVGAGGGCGCGN